MLGSPAALGLAGLGHLGQPAGAWGALSTLGLLVNLGLVHPALLGIAQLQAATATAAASPAFGVGAAPAGVNFGAPTAGMPPLPDCADDALVDLLIRWYQSGYHTGHFAARQGR